VDPNRPRTTLSRRSNRDEFDDRADDEVCAYDVRHHGGIVRTTVVSAPSGMRLLIQASKVSRPWSWKRSLDAVLRPRFAQEELLSRLDTTFELL
jgi:hypothetical protein